MNLRDEAERFLKSWDETSEAPSSEEAKALVRAFATMVGVNVDAMCDEDAYWYDDRDGEDPPRFFYVRVDGKNLMVECPGFVNAAFMLEVLHAVKEKPLGAPTVVAMFPWKYKPIDSLDRAMTWLGRLLWNEEQYQRLPDWVKEKWPPRDHWPSLKPWTTPNEEPEAPAIAIDYVSELPKPPAWIRTAKRVKKKLAKASRLVQEAINEEQLQRAERTEAQAKASLRNAVVEANGMVPTDPFTDAEEPNAQ